MDSYQEKVVEEKNDLDKKIDKLRNFIISDKYEKCEASQAELLGKQLIAMERYSAILTDRILLFIYE